MGASTLTSSPTYSRRWSACVSCGIIIIYACDKRKKCQYTIYCNVREYITRIINTVCVEHGKTCPSARKERIYNTNVCFSLLTARSTCHFVRIAFNATRRRYSPVAFFFFFYNTNDDNILDCTDIIICAPAPPAVQYVYVYVSWADICARDRSAAFTSGVNTHALHRQCSTVFHTSINIIVRVYATVGTGCPAGIHTQRVIGPGSAINMVATKLGFFHTSKGISLLTTFW